MTKKLVIVESPSKSKTIEQYLGEEYTVKSSKGHVRDLAIAGVGGLGIDINNDFKPQYDVIPDKKGTVKELNDAAKKANEIFLATDPDREGEAISWHLNAILDTKNKIVKRVIFNEITKSAILEAFEHPKDIDENLVSSQETRRIIDRIIGFKLSKLLQNKIKSKSAGRVQSAALKIIVDRENEINKFIAEEYYEIYAQYPTFTAQLYKYKDKPIKISKAEVADAIVNSLQAAFTVLSLEVKNKYVESRPPFITSTLQQDASNRYGFSATKTMQVAQRLYEGVETDTEKVGLISYMRTDSIRLSDSFVTSASSYIINKYGKQYLGAIKKANNHGNVQDAHEAIRPTDLSRTPESIKSHLSRDEYNLYQMIFARAVASLMKPTCLEQKTLILENNDALFKTVSYKQLFDGYLVVYAKYESGEEEQKNIIPDMPVGTTIIPLVIEKKQFFTQPPLRYSEARLIKEMEDLGIGRPSTYASTIATIRERKYVSISDKKFVPTEQGKMTITELDQYFAEFVSADYSKNMEIILDEIADGKGSQLVTIRDFYNYFIPLIDYASKNMERIKPTSTGEVCPKCGSPMVFRKGKFGEFEACSNFPACKYIKQSDKSKKVATPVIDTQVVCPECHKGHLVERIAGKGKNKGSKFYACSNFPKCKFISPYHATNRLCPVCQKPLVEHDNRVFCIDTINCGYQE
ncbi:MAG: type I DNA topoisomerase [Candidatus Izemoplasmatales bacterium]|jgi:DNA topoisomerase-1|nr:type I DNA topoisomerase [Candidatus Izemoplasmatales bacterium]